MGKNAVDWRSIVMSMRRGIPWILLSIVVCLCGALVYLHSTPAIYESESLLRIKQPQGLGSSIMTEGTENSANSTGVARKERMSTYAEILKSRNVIEPLIEDVANRDKYGKYPSYTAFIQHVTTTPLKDTEILKVSVSDTDPENAQRTNKAIIDQFLARLTELSHSEKKNTKEFLEGRVAEADNNLTEAENKLQDYQVKHQFVSPEEHLHALVERMSGVKKADEENKIDLAEAQARLASVNGQLSDYGISIADNTTIKQYNSKLADLEVTRVGYLEKYTDKHPKMIAINEQIQETKAALNAEIERVASMSAPSDSPVQNALIQDKFKSEAEIAVAQSKARALSGVNGRADAELSDIPAKEQGYVRAKRDVDVAQDLYTMLYKRLEEAKIAEVMVPNEVQLVDTPTLPEAPVKPRRNMVILLAGLLGLALGIAIAVLPELLRRRINTAADVEHSLGLEVLGSVPDMDAMIEKRKPAFDFIKGTYTKKPGDKWYKRLWRKICRK